MIFGDYPCCGAPLSLALPDRTPCFERELCPHCSAVVWHWLSRIDPQSYTEDGFLTKYEVEDVAKTIRERKR